MSALPSHNEEVKSYAPASRERLEIEAELRHQSSTHLEMPSIIDGREVRTGTVETAVMPHARRHILGHAHLAGRTVVRNAIESSLKNSHDWANWPLAARGQVFLKAAELLSGPWRARMNAATMLGQSKTVYQAEIDAAAELADFWRFNVQYATMIEAQQPISPQGVRNFSDYRPLEGFVLAITPFNFTAIAANLPTAPALMGNIVLWKPSAAAKLSAYITMQLLKEAGLPDGVINLVFGDPVEVVEEALANPSLAGVHFTGSSGVFNTIWKRVGNNLDTYRSYPRLVGETGGKNFILAHASADVESLATAIIRSGYEYQGQKCSAASRLYVPRSIWTELKSRLIDEIATINVGDIRDLTNFMGAVIDQKAFDRHEKAIADARRSPGTRVLIGGETDSTDGYFVWPTLIEVEDAENALMTEELFGPIVAVKVFDDKDFDAITQQIATNGRYGLTGAIFASDRRVLVAADRILRRTVGNFYINDKPTGAVVGQQPFGGRRQSGC
jgi:1-pyrroline-5-carboxylate dehydrogenase